MKKFTRPALLMAVGVSAWLALAAAPFAEASAAPERWKHAFPETDFSKHTVPFDEIISGGVGRDGIPSIDDPQFEPAKEHDDSFAGNEPVVSINVNGDARAYPLQILTWHEIVNDVVGGKPLAITYCPLCNSAVVFDAQFETEILEFGVSGMLRYSDLVMYDRQTGTWWQQFTGNGIVGKHAGKRLTLVPSRLESWDNFLERHPDGQVLVPNDPRARPYGRNPYAGYDSNQQPFLFRGELPDILPAMARVVSVEDQAWEMELLREKGQIATDDGLVLSWSEGQASALDSSEISQGRDVGNVLVQRQSEDGLVDEVYDVTFAFVFHAFHPEGTWHVR